MTHFFILNWINIQEYSNKLPISHWLLPRKKTQWPVFQDVGIDLLNIQF